MTENKTILVTRSSMPPAEEYINEIRDLWDSHWLTNNGSKHKRFEAELCRYLGVPYLTLFTNGHLALESAISAMNLSGEVITTPFTFASTTQAIVRNGLEPVFCDINPDDCTIDPEKIESLITEKTSAILPVHVYGNICRVREIDTIAQRYGLKVIYDAAHAFGVSVDGKNAAEFGDASMFSFHATKVFHTIEGGAVAYRDPALAEKFYSLKNFGINEEGDVVLAGGNAKMSEFQAAMGLCNLRHLKDEIGKRRLAAERYDERLGGVKGLRIFKTSKGVTSNYAYYPVLFEGYRYDRDEVSRRLKAEGIFSRKYFYPLTSRFPCYRTKYEKYDTPVAQYITDRVLTLPLYADLSLNDVDRICDIILN